MAQDHSMDIIVEFDFQELKNAVDQAQREITTRYDLKDAGVEVELEENALKVTAQSANQIEAVYGILVKRMIGRNLSPKILDRQNVQEIGGMRVRQEMKLIKALDQETAKTVSKLIRDTYPKVKPLIQGETVRVVSKSIDELQAVIQLLQKTETIKVPLKFTNYR